jgi:hypothetical protein
MPALSPRDQLDLLEITRSELSRKTIVMWKVRRLKYSTLLRLASKLLIFGPTKVMYALILYVWTSPRFFDSQNDYQEASPARGESGVADQDRNDEQRLLQQQQQPPQDPKVTVRVVRSVPSKPSKSHCQYLVPSNAPGYYLRRSHCLSPSFA